MKNKPKKPLNKERLHEHALWYLERYSVSAHKVGQVLWRKTMRELGECHETHQDMIDEVVNDLKTVGLLNDRLYAEGRIRSLSRQGKSQQFIRQKLYQDGIDDSTFDDAMTDISEEHDFQDEYANAHRYAKKRGLGIYRKGDGEDNHDDYEQRQKDRQAMLRRGFTHDVIQEII